MVNSHHLHSKISHIYFQLYRLTFWSRHSTKKRIGALDEEDEEENERQEG